jgi:hypothetical protein
MVMGGVGKVRSFRISRRLLLCAAFFFVAYVPFSAYLVNRYLDLRRDNTAQKERIERLERDLARSNHVVNKSREYILFLEDYALQAEKPADQTAEQVKPADKRVSVPVRVLSGEEAQGQEQKVAIEELVMERQGGKLSVNFKLVNRLAADAGLGGYIFMLAKTKDSLPRQEWTFPPVKLVNGLPETFRRGQIFLIQRFKAIQGKLTVGAGQDAPSILEILVYDQAGNILLNKDFEIANAPQ